MSYLPEVGAVLVGTPFTRTLSQRDLSLQIPVNYVTKPGVALTAACFPNGRYEDAAVIKCFSNLLAVDFRRFVVDIYWDVSRSIWSLCPAQLGDLSAENVTRSEDAAADSRGVVPRQNSLTFTSTPDQISSSSVGSVTTTTTLSTGSTTNTSPTSPSQPAATNPTGTAIQIGPYLCTESANLDLLLDVLSSHLDNTQTNVNATTKYLILNLHEAAIPGRDLTELSGDQLPQGDRLLSSIINSAATNLSSYLYTPGDLADQRADVNASSSWFAVNPSKQPSPAYFTVDDTNGRWHTPNGWPPESFVEMTEAKRLIVGFDEVDSRLSDYNFTADAATIFSSSYLDDPVAVGLASNGDVNSGCFFDPATTAISAVNNSWASFGFGRASISNFEISLDTATDLTRCGISSFLNATLNGVTADQDYNPYQQFVQSTVWSWAPGQPINSTTPDSDDPSLSNRCAVLNASSGYWQTEDCSTNHYSACRSFGQPYDWSINAAYTSYDKAELGCRDDMDFDVPRTALENRYLLHTWRNTIAARGGGGDTLLWLNFNDVDARACWVIGQNATCPYSEGMSGDRIFIVPTVAAVLVFVLAALTVFVKCASNRQNTKRRRRRGNDGWDYEGVPS